MTEPSAQRHRRALIGVGASAMPYQSPFGWIYRMSRLNGVRTHQLAHVFRLPPSLSLCFSGGAPLPWSTLHRYLNASDTGYDTTVGPHAWLPYTTLCHGADSSWLRGCRTCLAFGYHTYLHQLPWIESCPWHGEPLHRQCACGRPLLPRQQNTRHQRLLVCHCGHDPFDRSRGLLGMSCWPAMEVYRTITAHLRATKRSRERHVLNHAYGRFALPSELNTVAAEAFRGFNHDALQGVRDFNETTAAHQISTAMTQTILARWIHAVDNKSLRYESSLPLLPSDYERVARFARALSTEPAPSSADSALALSDDVITMGRTILLSAPSGDRPHALVEAPLASGALLEVGASLIHGVRDRLTVFRPLSAALEHTVHGQVLALALSDMAARTAMHGLACAQTPATNEVHRHVRRARSAPLALLTYRPATRIRIGFRVRSHHLGLN